MKTLFAIILASFFFVHANAGNVDTISIFSPSMKKNISCVVITPAAYRKSPKKLPVIYLLHGYSGSYRQWISLAPQLKDQVDKLDAIIVCPDGGYGSWYLDSPVDSSFRYETFVAKEVVNFIDDKYHTIADRQHRAITGLSMGGHGALYLGIRHQDIYGAVGSTSGGVDFRPFPNNWDLKKRLGDTTCCMENWNRNTVINLVSTLHNGNLNLIIDCGVKDFFIQVNRNFHARLLELGIDHDYIERPGEHNNQYWQNSIDYQLVFFKKFFEKSTQKNL